MRYPPRLQAKVTALYALALAWFVLSLKLVSAVAETFGPDWAEPAWLLIFFVSALIYLRIRERVSGKPPGY